MNHRDTKFGSIYNTEEALIAFDALLSEAKASSSKVFFLVDENTHEQCLTRLLPELPNLGEYELLEVPPGEESKSIEVAAQLWSALAELGANRQSILVNVGGGMITDLGGFIASTYMRGIRFCHIPTSLLGMVDASIGGKTAVDVAGVKNLVGAFAACEGVFLIPDFLETLPERELRSGFAEMLKHGLIRDASHYSDLIRTGFEKVTPDQVRASMNIKLDVVESDPLEAGARKELNFGHTLGHALESHFLEAYPHDPLLHGEAIAFGMWLELELSVLSGLLDAEIAKAIQSDIASIFGRLALPESEWESVTSWLKYDKKNTNHSVRFVLLENVGKAVIDCSVDPSLIRRAYENWQAS
ncbi:3-dehydroquinate synthase [Phaeocystidibacter marisrubri]|uniref:3-dehydroquinate synthase n=1 Tax=Phaeocystidibacter marisrubri TaxID=1577780 RepID=A0A6L3ZEU5_9FLAO|nr:3-dehydroquinate synthase [Phaeocystidibacter marisrubri]KAB2815947.1 3-dehydroquinate synthase [Phaeocystidibacter marisrubri]GGH66532.1 3-dehydroquinate synthase [Phaeocystidibacter marisrubri]